MEKLIKTIMLLRMHLILLSIYFVKIGNTVIQERRLLTQHLGFIPEERYFLL
jgi:hypothetical protein